MTHIEMYTELLKTPNLPANIKEEYERFLLSEIERVESRNKSIQENPNTSPLYDDIKKIEEAETMWVYRNIKGRDLECVGLLNEAIDLYEKNIAEKCPAPAPYDRLRVIYGNLRLWDEQRRVILAGIAAFEYERMVNPYMTQQFYNSLARNFEKSNLIAEAIKSYKYNISNNHLPVLAYKRLAIIYKKNKLFKDEHHILCNALSNVHLFSTEEIASFKRKLIKCENEISKLSL